MRPNPLSHSHHLAWDSSVNVVWDGNSLVYGIGSGGGQTLPAQVAAAAPVAGNGITTSNLGISGQTWADMTSGAGDVDSAWVSGKKNVLILWETTNYICNASANTPSGCLSQIAAYTAARRAVHPWIIVCLTSLPRETAPYITDQTSRNSKNADMVTVDAALLANPQAYGIDAMVDIRKAGSPFRFVSYTTADFNAAGTYYSESSGSRVHLDNQGYAVVQGYVSEVLMGIPRNPR